MKCGHEMHFYCYKKFIFCKYNFCKFCKEKLNTTDASFNDYNISWI